MNALILRSKLLCQRKFSTHGKYRVFCARFEGMSQSRAMDAILSRNKITSSSNLAWVSLPVDVPSGEFFVSATKMLESPKHETASLEFIGFSEEPLHKGFIEAVHYEASVPTKFPNISEFEFINYHDKKLMGFFEEREGFVAERVLKEQFSGALRLMAEYEFPQDEKILLSQRKYFNEHWMDWSSCLKYARTQEAKRIFHYLLRNPRDLYGAIKKTPAPAIHFFCQQYRQWLWDRTAETLGSDVAQTRYLTYWPTQDMFSRHAYRSLERERALDIRQLKKFAWLSKFFKPAKRLIQARASNIQHVDGSQWSFDMPLDASPDIFLEAVKLSQERTK